MSGGSWDYVYRWFEEVAERLLASKCTHRRALGAQVALIAIAMHDIEWVDSGDLVAGDEIAAIRAALGPSADEQRMAMLVDEAKWLIAEMKELGAQ